jgi:hypothetical protein
MLSAHFETVEDRLYSDNGLVVHDELEFDDLVTAILASDVLPIQVIRVERRADDVSETVAAEVIGKAWRAGIPITFAMRKFAEMHGVTVPEMIK